VAKAKTSKKTRLYTRYDPTTGQKVRVASDTFEYRDWPSRKPSKKKIQREALKSDPLGTLGQLGVVAGTRSAERLGTQAGRSIVRRLTTGRVAAAVAAAEALGVGTAVAVALPIAAALGGALYYYSLQPGADENRLSLQFVDAQKKLIQESGAKTWMGVPEEARTRLLNDYKRGLARIAEVRRATSLQMSNRYRKG
jgi:hypothetical protein